MDNYTFTKSQNPFPFSTVVPHVWGKKPKQLQNQDNMFNYLNGNDNDNDNDPSMYDTKNNPSNEITDLHNKLNILITKVNTLSLELNTSFAELDNNLRNTTTYVDSNIPKIKNLFCNDNLHVLLLKEYIKNNIIKCHNDHCMTLVTISDIINDLHVSHIECSCKDCDRVNTYYYSNEHVLTCMECSLFICPTIACLKSNNFTCE